MATLVPLDADQMSEQVRMSFRQVETVVVQEQWDDALLHLSARGLDAVVVGDLESPGDKFAQQPEGLPLRLRRRAAAEGDNAFWACVGPGRELVEQPALADAGIRHHGDGRQIAIDEQPLKGLLKCFEFGVPADHPRRHAFDAARDNPKRARLRTGN